MRLFAALGATLVLLVAPATAGGGDNPVLVFNEADGSERAGSRVVVSPTASDTVDNENLAYAKSHCADCRTAAAAMQAVLITSNASDVQPKNMAVAVNTECSSCRTFAAAYQYVVSTNGPVYLDDEGRQQIAAVREQVADAVHADLTFPELEARLDALYADFRTAVKEELHEAGAEFDGRTSQRTDLER